MPKQGYKTAQAVGNTRVQLLFPDGKRWRTGILEGADSFSSLQVIKSSSLKAVGWAPNPSKQHYTRSKPKCNVSFPWHVKSAN